MSEPPIIGSGKPHTVSLPEGSTVASHARKPTAGSPLPEDPPEVVRRGQAPDSLATEKPRARLRPAKRNLPAPSTLASPGAGAATATNAADAALLARIAELQRRNSQVRAQLDRVQDSGEEPA